MFERFICLAVSVLSIFSVFYSSKNMEICHDARVVATSNYVDVYFEDVSSLHGTEVTLSENRKSIVISNLVLQNVGDYEVIQYDVRNNSYSMDVDVSVLVNGVSNYQDDYFTITTTSLGDISSGDVSQGEIRITLNKAVLEDVQVPFEVQLTVK